MKIGDRFKDKTTGKIYILRMEIDNDTLCLEGENGLGRRLTGKESLKRTCEKLEDITSCIGVNDAPFSTLPSSHRR